MIIINYMTDEYYDRKVWDKRYCKSLTSARKELKRLLTDYTNEDKKTIKEIMKQFDKYVFNKKTCFSGLNWNLNCWELYIDIKEIDLI